MEAKRQNVVKYHGYIMDINKQLYQMNSKQKLIYFVLQL